MILSEQEPNGGVVDKDVAVPCGRRSGFSSNNCVWVVGEPDVWIFGVQYGVRTEKTCNYKYNSAALHTADPLKVYEP